MLTPGTAEKIIRGLKESFKRNNPPMNQNLRTNTAYGAPSPRGDNDDTGFKGFTRVRRREHDELQHSIYEAQPTPSRSKSKGSSH